MTTEILIADPLISFNPNPNPDAEFPSLTLLPTPAIAPASDADAHSRACPRCDSTPLLTHFDETSCIHCGYVEYSLRDGHEQTAAESNADESIDIASQPFRATTYAVRYAGAFPEQKGKLIYVTAYAEPNQTKRDALLRVKCPFCAGEGDGEGGETTIMSPASLSGKRRRLNEARFRCDLGHRLSLLLHGGDKPWVWE